MAKDKWLCPHCTGDLPEMAQAVEALEAAHAFIRQGHAGDVRGREVLLVNLRLALEDIGAWESVYEKQEPPDA